MKRLDTRGDTIVEVLFALIIISSVLIGAYATSNNSLKNSRQAQERGEALKLIESQVEQLKAMAEDPATSSLIFNTPDYCIRDRVVKIPSTDPACSVGTIPYKLQITQATPKFTVKATWANVTGSGNDQLTIVYKHDR